MLTLFIDKNSLARMRFLLSMVTLENMCFEFLENVSLILVLKKISVAKGKLIFKIRVRAAK